MGRPKGSKNKGTTTTKTATAVAEPNTTPVPEQEAATVLDPTAFEDEVGDGTEDYTKLGEDEKPPQVEFTQDQINLMLANTMQKLVESQPVKRIPWAKFKTKSPFNPRGIRRRKLTRRCYQNYNRLFIPNLHDEEISLLNQVRPGKYINGMVTIVEQQNGEETDLYIIYANKTAEQRMANLMEWRSLTELLKRCVTEGPSEAPDANRRRA